MQALRWLKRKQVWVPAAVALLAILAFSFLHSPGDGSTTIGYSDVLAAAQSGKLQSVDVHGEMLNVKLRNDSTPYSARLSSATDVTRDIQEATNLAASTPTAHLARRYTIS